VLEKFMTLKGYQLHSLDGVIGTVKDFYFDDRHWTIRYLVANTVNWNPGRGVLIAPRAINSVNQQLRTIAVGLTKKQIEDSPSLDSDKPVSRQYEDTYYSYYGWPPYWSVPPTREFGSFIAKGSETAEDSHLRSAYIVSGYLINAMDGEIGHIEDFIIDDESWAIRYLAIETQNWWPGKHVLVSAKWIERVSWGEGKVFVNLSKESIRQSPEYTANLLLTRDYENKLHRHYNLQGYWSDELAAKRDSLAVPSQNRDSRLEHEIKH
jgi:uncharacterized protein YrrD